MNQPTEETVRFEDALAELDQVVRDLEDGQIGLEESLVRYERGIGLIKACYAQLREAEQRILLLTGTDDDGKPILQPFLHTATSSASGDSPKAIAPLRPRRQTPDR
jgi:exodeoxyribonuclease VII small subunit